MTMYNSGVQVTEGRADKPKLIGSISYNEFTTASATKYKVFSGVLSRNAKARTIIFNNTLNQSTNTSPSFFPVDSTIGTNAVFGTALSGGSIPPNSQMYDTSERTSTLASHVDSCQIGIPMGTTLPTSGKIDVYIVEYF
jgi:hypothetical protein